MLYFVVYIFRILSIKKTKDIAPELKNMCISF